MRDTIAGIGNADWDRPSDLDGFTISGLVEHVFRGVDQFSKIAARDGFDPESMVAVVAAEATQQFDHIAEESLERWGAPQALARRYLMPWGEEQGERLAAYLVIEVVGHAWDIAGALERTLTISEELAGQVLEVARSFSEETLRAPGMFGPEQQAPDGATPLVELVSFLGRKSATTS